MFAVRLLARGLASREVHGTNMYGWSVAGFAALALSVLLMVPALANLFGMRAVLAG
jgi:Ca2+-transporting ATPase